MQFLALLGAPLKSRAIIELLEHWDIEVAYAFDRHSEGLPDEYQASSRDGGFQLLFDESQTLTTIFLHASSDSDFTPVDLPAQQLPDFHSMDEARAFAVKIGIEFTEGTADFVGEARTWIRLEWPSHSVHYEFREGALRLVTLSTRPD